MREPKHGELSIFVNLPLGGQVPIPMDELVDLMMPYIKQKLEEEKNDSCDC